MHYVYNIYSFDRKYDILSLEGITNFVLFHRQLLSLPVRLFYRKQEPFMNQNIQKEYHISQDGSGDFRSLF